MISSSFNKIGSDQQFEYNVTFNVIDSKSGNAITVTAIKVNNVSTAFTQSGKVITISVPTSGLFNLTIEATNYITNSGNYSYPTLKNANINMTAEQSLDDMEVVVTWTHSSTESSRDLDTYMYVLNGVGGTQLGKVYYSNTTYSDANTSATLDKDDQGAAGNTGETITVSPAYKPYQYHLYVYNYSQKDQTLPTGFADWACNVKVTYGNAVILNLTASPGSAGRLWNVFSINNGTLQTINTFSDTEPA